MSFIFPILFESFISFLKNPVYTHPKLSTRFLHMNTLIRFTRLLTNDIGNQYSTFKINYPYFHNLRVQWCRVNMEYSEYSELRLKPFWNLIFTLLIILFKTLKKTKECFNFLFTNYNKYHLLCSIIFISASFIINRESQCSSINILELIRKGYFLLLDITITKEKVISHSVIQYRVTNYWNHSYQILLLLKCF